LWLLGRAWYEAGRYARAVAILKELAAKQPPPPALSALLADACLHLEPPQLAEALEYNGQYLASADLTASQREEGQLVRARILLAQKDFAAAALAAGQIEASSPLYPQALLLQARILVERLRDVGAPADEGVTDLAAMLERLSGLLRREGLSPALAAQAHLLRGLLWEQQGDKAAAAGEFDRLRRFYFGYPEALAATIFHGDLVRPDSPREAVALYKRALSQVAGTDEAYHNAWLPAEQFRQRLSLAVDDLSARGYFAEALELAEALIPPFSQVVAVERKAAIHRAWAQHLESQAQGEKRAAADKTRAEARRHWREAGRMGYELATLRKTSRSYLDDLAKAADDYRRGQGYEAAAHLYRELLRQEPAGREPEALVGLGESLLALGKVQDALAPLARCREAFPKHPATYQARLIASQALEALGQREPARELLMDNLYRFALSPQSREWRDSLFALGGLLYRQGLELESRSRLAGVDQPDGAARRQGLALLEQSHAAMTEALRALREAVERYPQHPQTLQARYAIAEALRHGAKLPRKRLASVTIETSRAALWRQMEEQLTAAIAQYSALIGQLSDEEADDGPVEQGLLRNCYFGRADALFDLARYEEAIEAYSAATNRYQHEPASLEAYVQIASCYRRLGRLGEARGTLEQARVVLGRIKPEADFLKTTRFSRQDWLPLLDWLRTL
jgi:tetratricopeptide (TPR) repeat protein